MKLTPTQTKVLYQICQDVKNDTQIITLGGYAGTGKTVLVKYLTQFFPNFAAASFTGKAANVMRKREIDATTIHSRIYQPYFENGVLIDFELCPKDSLQCEGFIIDEGSMVNRDIHLDLVSYGLPIIYVGDHGQLEPVGTDFNLMQNPMYCLEEIHRNAGEIAQFAEHLRKGRRSITYQPKDDTVIFKRQKDIKDDDLATTDQIICAYNSTRVDLNKRVRAILGYHNTLKVGERVMCLRNNKPKGLFNGMQGIVRNIYRDGVKTLMDFEFDGEILNGIWYSQEFFNEEKPEFGFYKVEGPNPFDYAYAITAHKSQGDEFGNTLVYEQVCKNWDHRRWAYTSASRAKTQLKWAYN